MVQGTDIAGWISQNVIRFGKIYTPRRKLIKSTRCTEIARKLTNKKESKRFYIASRWMAKIATQNTVCGKISALFHVTFYFWLIFTVLHHIAVCFPLNMNGNIRTQYAEQILNVPWTVCEMAKAQGTRRRRNRCYFFFILFCNGVGVGAVVPSGLSS